MKKIVMILFALLMFASVASANVVDIDSIMDLFNIDMGLFLQLSVAVVFITEAVKRRLSGVFIGGWKTHTLVAVTGLLLSSIVLWGNPVAILSLSIGLYLFPASVVGAGKSLLEGFGAIPRKVKPSGLGYAAKVKEGK